MKTCGLDQHRTPRGRALTYTVQERTLHVFSRAAFVHHLRENLMASTDPRFFTVLSAGVHGSYANYENDPELSQGTYSLKNAADAAGFYNDIICTEWSKSFAPISFMHAAPGFVATRWGTEMPAPVRWLCRAMQAIGGRSQEDSAEYMFRALANPALKGPGFHLVDQYGDASTSKLTKLHEKAKDLIISKIEAIVEAGRSVVSS